MVSQHAGSESTKVPQNLASDPRWVGFHWTGKITVKFGADVSLDERKAYITACKLTIKIPRYPGAPTSPDLNGWLSVECFSSSTDLDMAAALQESGWFEYAYPDIGTGIKH